MSSRRHRRIKAQIAVTDVLAPKADEVINKLKSAETLLLFSIHLFMAESDIINKLIDFFKI